MPRPGLVLSTFKQDDVEQKIWGACTQAIMSAQEFFGCKELVPRREYTVAEQNDRRIRVELVSLIPRPNLHGHEHKVHASRSLFIWANPRESEVQPVPVENPFSLAPNTLRAIT